MPKMYLPTDSNGLVKLDAFRAMRLDEALRKLQRLLPEHVFTAEQLGSQALLDEAAATLVETWRSYANRMANPALEEAVLECVQALHRSVRCISAVAECSSTEDGFE